MFIKNIFQKKKIDKFSSQVYDLIKNEPELTNRSLREITNWMKNGSLYISLEKDQVVGFIVREKIANNFYEIKSLFVKKGFRGRGLGEKLMQQAIRKNTNYLISTFQDRIIKKTAKFGFQKTIFTKLPPRIALKYIFRKNLTSIFRHMLKKRSILLIKYVTD